MDTVLESQSLEKELLFNLQQRNYFGEVLLGVRSSPSLLVTTCAVAEEPGARCMPGTMQVLRALNTN